MKAALAGLLLVTAPALADERPLTRPTRDVDVTYVATMGGKPVQQRTRSVAGGAEVRIDTPSPGLYMIINRGAHTMDMVSDGDKGVVEMPYDPARGGSVAADGVAYRRLGVDKVAGLACTEWATTDTAGHAVTTCLTDDGVMLRARTGATVVVQAATVVYGTLDRSIFALPAGYQRAVAPQRR